MAEIHHRMPVIIDKSNFGKWFESNRREEINALLYPLDSEQITMHKLKRL